MYIRKFDSTAFEREYGESTLRVVPSADMPALPFSAMWADIDPGQSSAPNSHHEAEVFFIVEGEGEVVVDGERRQVSAGDVVYAAPFRDHLLHNSSSDSKLQLLSLWWEDARLLREAEQHWETDGAEDQASKVLVTATPPTVNGGLHLGHISGPYLAADVYRRYLELRGREVFYVSGSDENQSYVVTKARQKGWTPAETATRYADEVERALSALAIEVDVFARPSTSPHHASFSQEFFSRLHANGALELRLAPSLHCDDCDRYLFEAHVTGLCPHCGEGSDGCACEDCGRPNDSVDLVEPRCKQCGSEPSVREIPRFYFPLGKYEERLRQYLRSVAMTPHMAALCAEMLNDGLPDISVSHVADWGIPVPVEGFEDQVIYVWFEMCSGYLAATQQVADREASQRSWEEFWKSPNAIVQFFGFDNGYFHALLFPALLMAYDLEVSLPSTLVTNEFYLLDGEKFSSSREHAIWALDFLEREPSDSIRFYLSLDRPEDRRTSFTLAEYETRVRSELFERWMPWIARVGQTVVEEFDGAAPTTGNYTVGHEQFFRLLTRLTRQVEEAFDARGFSPSQAVRVLGQLVRAAERFGASESYLRGVAECADERRTAVALELAAVRSLATMAAPIVPDLSSSVWRALGFRDGGPRHWGRGVTFVPSRQDVAGLCAVELARAAVPTG